MPGGIFISYRRQDASDVAGRLYDRLADRFGEDQVFMDVDTIELGVDFAEVITSAVATCQVLLAVIGPGWATATDRDGRHRLDDPDDVVRLEVGAALDRDVRVIPVLVSGAAMPQRGELPDSLAKLARRNGLNVRHDSFRSDVGRLVSAIERVVEAGVAAGESVVVAAPQGPSVVGPVAVSSAPETLLVLEHSGEVNGVAFSPDGGLLATASSFDQTARLWEVASGQERARLAHRSAVLGVAFSPDGGLLATGSFDQTARLWEVASGQERASLAHHSAVRGVAFSPDGRLLATGSSDGTAQLWEVLR